jgi:Chitobiase/beta-hexosaminidase C-terminal domain
MVRILVCAIVLGLPTIVFGQPRVATPTFSVGGGEYTTVIMVVVRVSTPGATIHFTQNGSDPTEFDPVIVSGSRIAINTSQTLKARAWKTGSRPSAVRAETYQMVSVAAGPSIGAGDAAAGGAQSILARPDGRVFAWKSDATLSRFFPLVSVPEQPR